MVSKLMRRSGGERAHVPPRFYWTTVGDVEGRELVPLAEIRPTQMAVGMRVVEVKRRKIERHVESARRLRRYLEKRPVPAVLGPGDDFYILDHHHLSLALWQSAVDEVFVRIVGDLSDMTKREFLRAMTALGWLHAYDADGRKMCPTKLPSTIDQLKPDRYRDLAWSVREAGGFQKTYVPFSEFAWANYFRRLVPSGLLSSDFERAHQHAMSHARSPQARHLPGYLYS
jgi:hypothetical protein